MELFGLLIILIFNYLTPKSNCIRKGKKQLREPVSAKFMKSNIISGTGNLTLSYKNRFGFTEQTTFRCFQGKVYTYLF
mgnify:CR=1 FL=1